MTTNIRLRTSILRTFGFIVFVIGLVLTIYGHLADRTCAACEEAVEEVKPTRLFPLHSQRHEDVNFRYKDNDDDNDQSHYGTDEKPYGTEERQFYDSDDSNVNKKAIGYSKMVGPVALVLGLLLIVFSSLLSRRSKLNDSSDLNGKVHWTEEIMKDNKRPGVPVSVVQIHAQTQYFVTTSRTMDDLPNTSILDPPPSYEASMIEQQNVSNVISDVESQALSEEAEMSPQVGVPPPSYKTASMVSE